MYERLSKLTIWQKGHELTLKIYDVTRLFPKEEIFGLTSQMRRSAYSIPANIAEGCGRSTYLQLHFLHFSIGSTSELEYQIILLKDLNYISDLTFYELQQCIVEVRKRIHSHREKLD